MPPDFSKDFVDPYQTVCYWHSREMGGKLINGSESSTDCKPWSEQEQLRSRLQFVTSTYGTPLGSLQK